jgi:hypothetical protein
MPIDKVILFTNRMIDAYHVKTSGYQENEDGLSSNQSNLEQTRPYRR